MRYQDSFHLDLTKAYKVFEADTPKLRSINHIQKLNKNEALYPKLVLDQIIDVFKNNFSNWVQD